MSTRLERYLGFPNEFRLVKDVSKHQSGTHDQQTHGNWANPTERAITGLLSKLSEKKTAGFTIDLRTKSSPRDGYIVSDDNASRDVSWAKVSRTRDVLRQTIRDYVLEHAELLDASGAFFGGWVDEGILYLDVSRRYATRAEGVMAGFRNNQKAIYDVVNDSYIYMENEANGAAEKARVGRGAETRQRDERDGVGFFRGRDNRGNNDESLAPHVCLGRYQVQKHLLNQHDQRTHGNWAGTRYPDDSVKAARDGALEYSFKVGLEHDESIDYNKVVANRKNSEEIANLYEDLPKFDEEAVDEYELLADEVESQFDYMTKTLGVKVSFVADDPYKTSKEMFDDVSKGVLKVLQTESTGSHPILSDEQNNKFRAVHDYFGHAATGRGFGQDGEEAAWVHHSQMFTEKARAALTTETRGQNSFFNNRGKTFADQKVALLPSRFWEVPKKFTKRFYDLFVVEDISKHYSHDQRDHGNWARSGSSLPEVENPKANRSPEINRIAQDIRERRAADEPKVTQDMMTLSERFGGKMVDLQYRLKSEKSIARKVEADAQEKRITPQKAAEDMSDVIRYTMQFDTDGYTRGVQGTIAGLQEAGYTIDESRIKNFWEPTDGYQGLNAKMRHPNGYEIELQFHTPESSRVKADTHAVYEVYRETNNPQQRYKLYDRMRRIARQATTPSGALAIGLPAVIPLVVGGKEFLLKMLKKRFLK